MQLYWEMQLYFKFLGIFVCKKQKCIETAATYMYHKFDQQNPLSRRLDLVQSKQYILQITLKEIILDNHFPYKHCIFSHVPISKWQSYLLLCCRSLKAILFYTYSAAQSQRQCSYLQCRSVASLPCCLLLVIIYLHCCIMRHSEGHNSSLGSPKPSCGFTLC